jgi:hypothetical protein
MPTLVSLNPEARDRLQNALQRGEVVRWVATADPDHNTEARLPGFLDSRTWLAGSTVLTVAAAAAAYITREPEPFVAAVLGAFFVFGSLLDVVFNLLEKRRARRRVHAVTDRRILVLDPSATPPLVEIDPHRLAFVAGFESREGWGDVDIQYRADGSRPDDPEKILTFHGVPEIDVASHAIERLAFEHGNDLAEPADDEDDTK